MVSYRATAPDGAVTISADEARRAWDLTPEHLRSGRRDGAFMLFDEDELGRRTPIVYQPIGSPAPVGPC